MSEAEAALHAWDSFYVIMGSSAAALTGLMFVVVSLMPEAGARLRARQQTISAFATPTVMHLCAALLVAAILTAPWRAMGSTGVAITATGLGGMIYGAIVLRRVRGQDDYKPVAEDWTWHVFLPLVAYAVLLAAGLFLAAHPRGALFGTGGATLMLLFIGIHNAWDTVMYITITGLPEPETRPAKAPGKAPVAEAPASGEPPHSVRP